MYVPIKLGQADQLVACDPTLARGRLNVTESSPDAYDLFLADFMKGALPITPCFRVLRDAGIMRWNRNQSDRIR